MNLLGNKFFAFLTQAVFPRFCVNCGAEGSLLCDSCSTSWQREPPANSGSHLAVFAYANPIVRKLMCAWKYDYDQTAFQVLKTEANEILTPFKIKLRLAQIEAIVPMPLSERRTRERGFNQSRVLAEWLARELQLPMIEPLLRVHRHGHQATRSVQEREAAMVYNPFLLKKTQSLPSTVLLVDDVLTTGATIRAAKTVLEANGQTQVLTLTLAQG